MRVKQTHCKHGHEYTPENTTVNEFGWRNCKRCDADRHYAKNVGKNRERRKYVG
jgi:hypothetical protein